MATDRARTARLPSRAQLRRRLRSSADASALGLGAGSSLACGSLLWSVTEGQRHPGRGRHATRPSCTTAASARSLNGLAGSADHRRRSPMRSTPSSSGFQALLSTPTPPSPAPHDRLARRARDRDVDRATPSPTGGSPCWSPSRSVSFGLFGYWEDSIDLLIVTLVSVVFAVIIGMPLAHLDRLEPARSAVVIAVLDLLQTMPTFVYLMLVFILFGIGAPNAIVCTVIYALPPLIRIAGFGIRDVSPSDDRGHRLPGADDVRSGSGRCRCRWPARPSSWASTRRIMAALSMAIIAGVRQRSRAGQAGAVGADPERLRRAASCPAC